MKLSKKFKYATLTLVALTTMGVTLSKGTTAKAINGQQDDFPTVTFSPKINTGGTTKISKVSGGSPVTSGLGGDPHFYSRSSPTVFKYTYIGEDQNTGKAVDMKVKLYDLSSRITMVGYKKDHGISVNMNGGGRAGRTMKVQLSFYYHGTNTQVKWNDDSIGVAFSDLEPKKLGADGVIQQSFGQYVKKISAIDSWNPYSNLTGKQTFLNNQDANQGYFHMDKPSGDPWNFPTLAALNKKSGKWGYNPASKVVEQERKTVRQYIHSFWTYPDAMNRDLRADLHYTGAIAVYKAASGAKTISFLVGGHSQGNDEFILSDANIKVNSKPKSTISKSITYNGKTSTANTLKDKDDTMVYNVNATVSAKKGAYITDTLPKRFTVTKISAVTNFSHNSVADVNSTHKFKATLNNNKLDGKNKKITFHITGNMGTWMDKHPSMVGDLKWPVDNTAYWYQKTTGKLKSPGSRHY